MRPTRTVVVALMLAMAVSASTGFGVTIAPAEGETAHTTPAHRTRGTGTALRGRPAEGTRLVFEPNVGQADPDVRFVARTPGSTLLLAANEAVLRLGKGPGVMRMRIEGGRVNAKVEGLDRQQGTVNYYRGTEPATWRSGVPTYAKVAYRDVYPGVDVMYYGNGAQVEYDFVVAPGSDPSGIGLAFDGARSLGIDERGDLLVRLDGGEVRHRRPIAYQDGPKGRRTVRARYVVQDGRVRFALGRYDGRRPLVIDPIVYSTYIGGGQAEQSNEVVVDSQANAIMVGSTNSVDYPVHNQVMGDGGFDDAIVTKFNPNGSGLVYSTYLSGIRNDSVRSVAVDGLGSAYVVGDGTTGFPTTAGRLMVCGDNDEDDIFIAKLNASGALVYSTCLGGSNLDDALDVAIDGGGNAYVAGATFSSDFPTANAFQPVFANTNTPEIDKGDRKDGVVFKLNATGTGLVWSTYFGGSGREEAQGIALDASGVYLTGTTTSTSDFPLAGSPYQATYAGGITDLFVAKLTLAGGLTWSTYLGGSAKDGHTVLEQTGIAVDGAGRPTVADATFSTNFPTTPGAFQTTAASPPDFFITKLNATGSGLVYSTYLGGNDWDSGDNKVGLAVDGSGSAYLAGRTKSTDLPTANPIQAALAGSLDLYVAKLNPQGSALVYGTYLGGTLADGLSGGVIAVDPDGNAYVATVSGSPDYPTTEGAYQRTLTINPNNPVNYDIVVTKLDSLLGFLRITTTPSLPSQITVDGVPRTTWGTINLEASPGTHQVCFRDVEGFTKPACQSVTVNNGAATQVAGNFVQRGFLQVVTNPALPAKITVDDVARDDWGIYTDLPVGTYRVCFGPVKDYAPPPCENATVTAGTTKTVAGNYTLSVGAPGEPAGNGALRVTTNPALPSQITVDGVPRGTWGLINLQIAPGSHTVCFRDVEGFITPACQTVNVTAGATTVSQGDFVAKGFLQVVSQPALPTAIYVNGIPRDDWGLYTDYPVGTYEVCFGAVWGYRTPPCRTVTVTAGATTTVTGTFSTA